MAMVIAIPVEDLESQQPAEQIEADANSLESDLEVSESRYSGYGRGYGGYGKWNENFS